MFSNSKIFSGIRKIKGADFRYDALDTKPNQPIAEEENYGVKPILGAGTAWLDFDDKERYRKYAEHMIKQGFMVNETGQGWHIPVTGLLGEITKMNLFDYNISKKKPMIEIQGPKQYVMGTGSIIFHDKLKKIVSYQNVGGNKIWDVKRQDFGIFVDKICSECKVEGKRKKGTSAYQYLRKQFNIGKPPKEGESNNYFHQAAMVCNTENLSLDEAIARIREIFEKWEHPTRSWSDVESKIKLVYENDEKIKIGRKPKVDDEINRTEIAQNILLDRKIYSNVITHKIWEDKNGFLELINNTLKKEIFQDHPEIEKSDMDSILFKLESGAGDIPETDKSLIVFPNGVVDTKARALIETERLADMGFRQYKYLSKSEENKPTEFIKVLFENIPEIEHPRINAGLKSILNGQYDTRISIIHGDSRIASPYP